MRGKGGVTRNILISKTLKWQSVLMLKNFAIEQTDGVQIYYKLSFCFKITFDGKKIFAATKENFILRLLFSNTTFIGTQLYLHCRRALLRQPLVLLSPLLSIRVYSSGKPENRRNFLRILGEQRRKPGEREARVACEGRSDSRFVLVSLSPSFC